MRRHEHCSTRRATSDRRRPPRGDPPGGHGGVRGEGTARHVHGDHRAQRGHLAALPVPAVRHQEGAVPGCRGALLRRHPWSVSGWPSRRATRHADATHWIGEAYREMLRDGTKLRMQMQSYAACDDPDVRRAVQTGFGESPSTSAAYPGSRRAVSPRSWAGACCSMSWRPWTSSTPPMAGPPCFERDAWPRTPDRRTTRSAPPNHLRRHYQPGR